MNAFACEQRRLRIGEAHALDLLERPERRVLFVDFVDAAVVLGSTQSMRVLSHPRVVRQDLTALKRHSGGGAVVLRPGEVTWFDVVVPREDPLFVHDISVSSQWLGSLIRDALRSLGVDTVAVAVASQHSEWDQLVCFAGLAAGEVVVAGGKAVGISQRRTRQGARFQVLVVHHFDAQRTADLFDLGVREKKRLVAHLTNTVSPVPVAQDALRTALIAQFVQHDLG